MPTTLLYSEFIFENGSKAYEAFKNVGRGPKIFKSEGLKEVKLMGAGAGNGFSILPNFKRYALLFFFDQSESLQNFVETNSLFRWYWENASQKLTAELTPFKGHGLWNSKDPFAYEATPPEKNEPIAVITRATIRLKRLLEFWRNVPKVASFMHSAPALHQVGIGEYPLFMQATFSIWENLDQLRKTAYSDTVHAEIVRKTRQRGWYKEELFVEFKIESCSAHGTRFKRLTDQKFTPLFILD